MRKQFNCILDTDPNKTWVSVIKNTDFKIILSLYRILDYEISETEKGQKIIDLLFDGEAPDLPNLWEYIINFVSCGKLSEDNNENKEVYLDFNYDHGRIYAAFLQAYNIDLTNTKMHWWHFCELLNNLPENTTLSKVIEIRSKKIDNNNSKEYNKELRKLKRSVAIPKKINAENATSTLDNFFDRANK